MTNVSKRSITSAQRKQLRNQLAQLLHGETQTQTATLLTELLTEAEEIMLIKRCAIIVLLTHGQSTYRIAKMVGVSDVTVTSTKEKLKRGEYQAIEARLQQSAFDACAFLDTVESVLHLGGLLPKQGKHRWQNI